MRYRSTVEYKLKSVNQAAVYEGFWLFVIWLTDFISVGFNCALEVSSTSDFLHNQTADTIRWIVHIGIFPLFFVPDDMFGQVVQAIHIIICSIL